MPYISQELRDAVAADLADESLDFIPESAAEFNFIISTLIANYLAENGKNYANINEMIGALECAKLELYRVVAAPYENQKRVENGGVYE